MLHNVFLKNTYTKTNNTKQAFNSYQGLREMRDYQHLLNDLIRQYSNINLKIRENNAEIFTDQNL